MLFNQMQIQQNNIYLKQLRDDILMLKNDTDFIKICHLIPDIFDNLKIEYDRLINDNLKIEMELSK